MAAKEWIVTDERSWNIAKAGLMREYLRYVQAAESALEPAMDKFGQAVLRETLPITPMDTGALRASGKYEQESKGKTLREVIVGFGDETTMNKGFNYAYWVHEDLYQRRATHPTRWTAPGTGGKYLQIGAMEVVNHGEELIGVVLKQNLRGFR